MARFLSLAEAVESTVRDGDTVAIEGFTHLIPHAAGHEIIRQQRKRPDAGPHDAGPDLRPDDRHGLRATSSCSPGAAIPASARCTASATRSRTAGRSRSRSRSTPTPRWRTPTRPAPPACRCAVFRGYIGVDLPKVNPNIKLITCPFTGETARRGAGASGPTSRSSTRRRPTAPATCCSKASSACRRRPCWPPSARSSRSRRSSTTSARAAPTR